MDFERLNDSKISPLGTLLAPYDGPLKKGIC